MNLEEIIEKAWKKFTEYYDDKVANYSKSLESSKTAKDAHWICWNESDLMLQLGRFFYRELDNETESKVEMHFDKNISFSNFKGYRFESQLGALKEKLKRIPKLDLIITEETSEDRFLLCGEAKYFHCSVEGISRNNENVEGAIRKDIDTLLELKGGIAERVVLIIFDDYYWLKDKQKSADILNLLEKAKSKGIKVLYHDSKSKVKHFVSNQQ